MTRLVAAIIAVAFLVTAPLVALAQAAPTPTAAPVPPVACSVDPIPYQRLARIVALPVATPAPVPAELASPVPGLLPPGTPADDAATQEIDRRILLVTACANAGDLLRTFALYSDRFLSTLLAGQAIPEAAYRAEIGKINPRPAGAQKVLYGFSPVVIAADGRAVVSVLGDDLGTPRAPSYTIFYFVHEEGEWRIDASYDVGVNISTGS